jgi:predicted ribosome quality control (RQC) complex YloA/Tae2 family protein
MRKDIARKKRKKEGFPDEERQSGQVYDKFSPLSLHQFKSRNFIKLGTSDESMDEFFSKIESQRADQQQKAQEQSPTQKLNKIRLDQENRVQSLKKEVDYSIHMAELIEYNLEDVDAAILVVRAALASGMDWKGLVRMVKEEKKDGNPIAGLIHSLQLEKNCITLLLSNNIDDMDEEEKTQPVDKVEVDLALSAYANARR